MNKETRGFIWGLISVFSCAKLIAGVGHSLINNLNIKPIEWFGLPFATIGIIYGSYLIYKAI